MYKKIIHPVTTLFITISLLLLPLQTFAQETDTYSAVEDELFEALNSELGAYESYQEYADNLEYYSESEIVNEYDKRSKQWNRIFMYVRIIYRKYSNESSIDYEFQKIASTALAGSNKAIEAIETYDRIFSGNLNEYGIERAAEKGDDLMNEAVLKHDEAVDLYNDYTGASVDLEMLDWLYVFTFISVVISTVLFFKSRTGSIYDADIIRAAIYKDLFKSSLWMLAGLAITTVTLRSAVQEGGTYYILYGPVLVGFLGLAEGLRKYFTEDRKILKELKKKHKKELMSKILANIKKKDGK